MREKLIGYSLNLAHDEGGPKAQGFARILGIKIADIALGARERRDRASADNRLSQALTWRNDGNR
ncbi:MAG TPA: hypothetical protein VFR04_09155 [Solirubrobacterales bacterium]|nr:hypothetical protein [Solirubrobacterales bacterium]